MNRPVSRRNEAAWREEVRRLARIQEGAKLERERPVEWGAFVALLARGLASAIDPDAPGDEARMEAAMRYVREARCSGGGQGRSLRRSHARGRG